MSWKTIGRPGFFGEKRDETFKQYNEKYGEGNWKIAWKWKDEYLPHITACQIYEDAYYSDSFRREDLWKELIKEAKDVYDHHESDIESGLDYLVQKGAATHLQDIAVRRVVMRRGWKFQGDKLIQIRSHKEYWGEKLSPGKVKFHLPELIIEPRLEGWWDDYSIEQWYQSAKVLQIKE